MPEIKMDAEIVASIIHKGNFSKLRGKSFKMCDNKKRKRHTNNMRKTKDKITLSKLAVAINDLAERMDAGFKQVNTRLDYIVQANNLKDLPRNK